MAYIVCHAEKQDNLMSMPHHIDRIGAYNNDGTLTVYPDDYKEEKLRGELKHPQIIHPERRKWNKGGGATFEKFNERFKEEISKLERKPQGNASPTICFNNSAGEDFWKELREKYPKDEDYYAKCEEYFTDCREVLDELYPYGKTIKWTTHYEEKEPHMHCLKIPIINAPKRLNKKAILEGKKPGKSVIKFSSGEFLGGREGLVKLQDAVFNKVGKKWGLERGERGSDAKHTDQIEWQRELARKDKELTAGLKLINEIRDEYNRDSVKLLELKNAVEKKESEVTIAEERIKAQKVKLNTQKEEQEKNVKNLEEKENDVKNREADLKNRENDVSFRENFVKRSEKAIISMKNKLNIEDRINVSIIERLDSENVSGVERKKFLKEFFIRLPTFISEIIRIIRRKPEQKTNISKTETNEQKLEEQKNSVKK